MEIDMELSIQDLGALGEFVGAIAVVITLLYLVVQLRQNTKSVRASTHQAISSSYIEVFQALQDSDFSSVYVEGMRQYDSLTGEQQVRFNAFALRLFKVQEDAYFQWQNGNYDERSWATNEILLLDILSVKGVRQWWETRKPWFNQEFVIYTDDRLVNHSVASRFSELRFEV